MYSKLRRIIKDNKGNVYGAFVMFFLWGACLTAALIFLLLMAGIKY